MKTLLCVFRPCVLRFFGNVRRDDAPTAYCGLYQCARCKTISIGARQ